jgi:hypothetical protein
MNTIKKNSETLLEASAESGLEVSKEKTKHMVVSRHQNIGQHQNSLIANKFFEKVATFQYFGMTVTNQNYVREEIKSRLHSGNAC